MWGTPKSFRFEFQPVRFIPTRVGNTVRLLEFLRSVSVHPHTCGEHNILRLERVEVAGSSPHVWGTQEVPHLWQGNRRFIPTRVGNTDVGRGLWDLALVHPHTCGEHCRGARLGWSASGSSPHVWGTRDAARAAMIRARFIPTRVGNTVPDFGSGGETTVHPHTCGEHGGVKIGGQWQFGSSPHVWGTPAGSTWSGSLRRFIPTRVGNTCPRTRLPRLPPVHPHTCGEHHRTHDTSGVLVRFIPTRVGNTLAGIRRNFYEKEGP